MRPGEMVGDGDRSAKSKAEVNLVCVIVDGGVSNLAGLFNVGWICWVTVLVFRQPWIFSSFLDTGRVVGKPPLAPMVG